VSVIYDTSADVDRAAHFTVVQLFIVSWQLTGLTDYVCHTETLRETAV